MFPCQSLSRFLFPAGLVSPPSLCKMQEQPGGGIRDTHVLRLGGPTWRHLVPKGKQSNMLKLHILNRLWLMLQEK